MLQPKLPPRGWILSFFQIQVTSIRSEPSIPIDKRVVGVGRVVHVVGVLDEFGRQGVRTSDEIAVDVGAVPFDTVEQ